LKFADDTKVCGIARTQEEVDNLHKDILNLCQWSDDWLMLFNVDKCKVIHFGHGNKGARYTMNGKELDSVLEEKDLGVIIQHDLKWGRQCAKAASTGNRVLGMITRSFTFKSRDIILQLYKSLVRPHLEYCVQAWRPHLIKDIDLLERVQKRALRLIPESKGLEYEVILRKLGLTTLETRRLRGDLIEVFKIIKGFEDIDKDIFFKCSHTELRGHSLKLYKTGCNLDCKKYGFAHRVVNPWNALPQVVIACDTVNSFKANLDKYLVGRGFI